jgi:hypothetical protein
VTTKQQAWKAAKRAAGLCIQCGAAKLVTKNHCEPCRLKSLDSKRRYMLSTGNDKRWMKRHGYA